jgi:hypothetical protein
VAAASAVAAAAAVTVAEEKIFTEEREREKWCNCHVTWFYGYWRWG